MINLYQRLADSELAQAVGEDVEEERTPDNAEKRRQAHLFGLRGGRAVTSGQIRRAQKRAQATQSRKATKRHRRSWMANEQAVARLRGQLVTVAAIKGDGGKYLVGQSPALMKNAHEQLERAYGSVDMALEHYESIMAERQRAAKQAQVKAAMQRIGA